MPEYKLPLSERFHTKYNIVESGCWEWNGALRTDGYGILKIDGRNDGAHRYSYILHNGEIGEGLLVLHKCDNRSCVNPDHLFLGTIKDNTDDKIKKGRTKKSHGTIEALTSNCKCKVCRDFRGETDRPKAEHSSMSTYTKGCRCDECKEAKRLYMKQYRENKTN